MAILQKPRGQKLAERSGKGQNTRQARKDRGSKITDASVYVLRKCGKWTDITYVRGSPQMIAIGRKDLIQSHDINVVKQ